MQRRGQGKGSLLASTRVSQTPPPAASALDDSCPHWPWNPSPPPSASLPTGKNLLALLSTRERTSSKEISSWPLGTPLRVPGGLRPREKLLFPFLPWKESVEGAVGPSTRQVASVARGPQPFFPPTPYLGTLHGSPA